MNVEVLEFSPLIFALEGKYQLRSSRLMSEITSSRQFQDKKIHKEAYNNLILPTRLTWYVFAHGTHYEIIHLPGETYATL